MPKLKNCAEAGPAIPTSSASATASATSGPGSVTTRRKDFVFGMRVGPLWIARIFPITRFFLRFISKHRSQLSQRSLIRGKQAAPRGPLTQSPCSRTNQEPPDGGRGTYRTRDLGSPLSTNIAQPPSISSTLARMRSIAVLPAADFPAISRARTELLQNITTPPLTSHRYAGLPFKAAHGAELRNGEFGGIHKKCGIRPHRHRISFLLFCNVHQNS